MIDAGNVPCLDSFSENLQRLASLKAVKRSDGRPVTTPALSRIIAHQNSPKIEELTPLQQQVLKEILLCHDYGEVAKKLGRTYRSVKIHASRISRIL